eukprot:jgi/Tetstr1/424491/TSEL_015019.t1
MTPATPCPSTVSGTAMAIARDGVAVDIQHYRVMMFDSLEKKNSSCGPEKHGHKVDCFPNAMAWTVNGLDNEADFERERQKNKKNATTLTNLMGDKLLLLPPYAEMRVGEAEMRHRHGKMWPCDSHQRHPKAPDGLTGLRVSA